MIPPAELAIAVAKPAAGMFRGISDGGTVASVAGASVPNDPEHPLAVQLIGLNEKTGAGGAASAAASPPSSPASPASGVPPSVDGGRYVQKPAAVPALPEAAGTVASVTTSQAGEALMN